MAVFLSPIIGTQLQPGGNQPANGFQLFTYITNSSTKQSTFTTSLGNVANSNPIVLDSGGRIPGSGEIWLTQGVSYRFVLAPANDTDPPGSPVWTMDNLTGIGDPTGIGIGGEWVAFAGAPTFAGATSFTVTGDQTAIFTVGRRVKSTNTGGTIFSTITSSVFAVVTTVTVVNDSGVLDAGLSSVSYGALSTPNGSVPFTQFRAAGIDHSLASVTSGVLTATSTVNSPSFIPTGTSAALSGLYLPATANPAIAANSTKIMDWTSTQVNITGAGGGVINLGTSTATTGNVRLAVNGQIVARSFANSSNVTLIESFTDINTNPDLVRIGNASGGIIAKGRANSSAPTVNNLNASEWTLWRDTAASTTRFYYNNAGTIMSSAAFA